LLDRRKSLAVEKVPELARKQELLADEALIRVRAVTYLRHVVRQAALAAHTRTLSNLGLGLREKLVVVFLAHLLQVGDADVSLLQHTGNKLQCARCSCFPAKAKGEQG